MYRGAIELGGGDCGAGALGRLGLFGFRGGGGLWFLGWGGRGGNRRGLLQIARELRKLRPQF